MTSEKIFSKVKEICEQKGKKECQSFSLHKTKAISAEEAKHIINHLAKVDVKLPQKFSRSLHYLGRIYLHKNQITEAVLYMKNALTLQEKLIEELNGAKTSIDGNEEKAETYRLIFKRRGIGFLKLKQAKNFLHAQKIEKAKRELQELKKFYESLLLEENHQLNQVMCRVQLSRIDLILGNQEETKKGKEHYYHMALNRLKGVIEDSDINGFRDEKAQAILEFGKIFATPGTSYHNPKKAEELFLRILEQGERENTHPRYKAESIFEAYYQLATLYKNQIKPHHCIRKIVVRDNEALLFKAKESTLQALQLLRRCSYQTFLVIREEKKEKIKQLEEILEMKI